MTIPRLDRSRLVGGLILALAATPAVCQEPAPVKHVVDTHIHLYDTTRKPPVTWPRAEDKVLYKPHLPAEYSKIAKAAGVTAVVIVEASLRLEDNDWVLDLVKDDPFYVGLVGNVDLLREDFDAEVARLKKDPRFVGVRARGAEPIDFSHDLVLANLWMLSKQNLALDYLTNGGGVPGVETASRLARTIPQLRIVVDHCLGYNFDGKPPSREWQAAVRELAANPNVFCKISGLYQRSVPQPAPQDLSHYREVLEMLWENFGAERLVYGSNWPVTKHTGDYAGYRKLVDQWITEKGQEARERFYWQNAARAYRLPLK